MDRLRILKIIVFRMPTTHRISVQMLPAAFPIYRFEVVVYTLMNVFSINADAIVF